MDPMGHSSPMDPHMLDAMYRGADAQGRFLIYASSGLVALTTVAVALRFLARWRTKLAYGADDICIGLSIIPLWCLVVLAVIMVQQGGLGLPSQFLTPSQANVFYKVLFASTMLYALAITIAKISILLFYRRIFNTIVTFRYATYIVGGFCLLWFLVVMLVSALQCHPVSYAWDKMVDGTCIDLRAMYYSFTISNVALDVIINVMPVRLIWKLQLSIKKKILLTIIMLMGTTVIVASVGRISSVKKLAGREISASILMPIMTTIIEPAFAIICACLPTYGPLFLWISTALPYSRLSSNVKTWFRSISTSRGSSGQGRSASRFAAFKIWSSSTKSSSSGGSHASPTMSKGIVVEKYGDFRSKDQKIVVREKSVPLIRNTSIPGYDQSWGGGNVTRACESGVYYEHDDDIQNLGFPRSRAGDVSPMSSV